MDRRITKLRRALKSGDGDALAAFWRDVSATGAPLLQPEGKDHSLVTFICQGDANTAAVHLHAAVDRSGEDVHAMARLAGTDLWHTAHRLRNDYLGTYKFEVFDSADDEEGDERPDPFNERVFIEPADPDLSDFNEDDVDSVLELPGAPDRPWVDADVPAGTHSRHAFISVTLGNKRRVWMYRSPGLDASDASAPLLIVPDGRFFVYAVQAPGVLDFLRAAGRIPPLAAVFVDNPGNTWEEANEARGLELTCRETFADFLADELLPWLRREHDLAADPARTIVSGGSLGGLAAAHAALARPDAFANALSLSGSFWWKPDDEDEWEWLARRAMDVARTLPELEDAPRRFFIEVGMLESAPRPGGYPGQVLANRHMRDVLRAAGFEVTYAEEMHGHDSIAWQKGLADGLGALI